MKYPITRALAALAVAATAFGAALSTAPARAQAWPAKPIRLIVPFTAGGPTDQVARRLAEPLSQALGQPVIVENVPGASGAIGLQRLVRAPADGYTLALGANATLTIVPNLTKVPYDTMTELQPIGGRVKFSYALVAAPSETARNAAELVARSKTAPQGVSYGSAGVGSGGHLIAELLRVQTGGNFTHVPYKGVAPAQADLAGNHLGFMFDVVGTAAPLVAAGKLKALGVTGTARSPSLPGVPAVSESVPGFESVGWYAFYGPKGMPREVVMRLNAEMARIYRTPDYLAFFEKTGYDAAPETPEELSQVMAKETAQWERVIKAAGIKAE